MHINLIELLIALCVLVWFATNVGMKSNEKEGIKPILYMAVIGLVAYLLWPYYGPVVTPLINLILTR